MFSGFYQSFSALLSSYWYGPNAVSMNKSRKFAALILITVILSLFHGQAIAQDDDEEQGMYLEQPKLFYGGLVGGASFSQVDGDYFAGYHKFGINAGPILYAQVAKHVALSIEILYAQRGSKSSLGKQSPKQATVYLADYGINLNYAEIPLMINYFDKQKSHFGLGVSYSRLVNSKETLTTDSANIVTNHDFNTLYPFKKNAFDFVAGAELHLWKGLYLNVRFQYSLVPVRDQLPPDTYARANQYSNSWTVRLMYLVR